MDKPIVEMFWVAEYNNGRALAEYNVDTKMVNLFEWVDHKNVLRFWWFPITPQIASLFPGTRVNPRLKRCGMDMNGSKGFVSRRNMIELPMGSTGEQDGVIKHIVKCYIVGVEGGPRVELYPDGSVIPLKEPRSKGETQDVLHHG